MTRDDILDLAARVEALAGPDRAVDFDILHLVQGRMIGAAKFTASLDAAMQLVPNEAFWRLGNDGEGPDPSVYRADVLQTPGVGHHIARARHPALALTAASLRAIAEGQGA